MREWDLGKIRESERGLEEKRALPGLLPMAQIPTEPFLQHTGYSLERGGNSAAPYFPLRSDLYVFHTVLPERVLTSTVPLIRCSSCNKAVCLNRVGLLIISPRANMLAMKHLHRDLYLSKNLSAVLLYSCHDLHRTCVLYNKWCYFLHEL